jgi:hypothetical protein
MCEEAPAPLTCQAKVSGSMARQQYGPSRGIKKKNMSPQKEVWCRHFPTKIYQKDMEHSKASQKPTIRYTL